MQLKVNFQPRVVHQYCGAISGIIVAIAALWSILFHDYGYLSFGAVRNSILFVTFRLYQLGFGAALFVVFALGMKDPVKWFGMLATMIGTGLSLIFIGIITAGSAGYFGYIGGFLVILAGIGCTVYGYYHPSEETEYVPLLG